MRNDNKYRNIQGRKAGKATKDLHYRREVTKNYTREWAMTQAEKNLYRKVKQQVEATRTQDKRQHTNRIMRLLMILKRFFNV